MRKLSKIFAFLLIFALLFSAVSCKYRPVRSTEEEATTVFTVDEKYEVPYELYRFVYLAEKDRAIASGETYDFETLDRAVRREICRIYALYNLCEKYGVDAYSKEVEKAIKAEIKTLIEDKTVGYGKYDAYLADLAENHMNDSVFRFYLRYDICEEYLATAMHANAFVPEDDTTVLSHYLSDNAVRATWIYIPSDFFANYTDAMLRDLVNRAKAASDEDFMRMTHEYYQTLYSDDELETGFYFGRHQLSDEYDALSEAAFSLEVGETSSLVYAGEGAYVVRRLTKDAAYLQSEENIEYLRECYLLNAFYSVLAEEAERLGNAFAPSAFYATLSDETVK